MAEKVDKDEQEKRVIERRRERRTQKEQLKRAIEAFNRLRRQL